MKYFKNIKLNGTNESYDIELYDNKEIIKIGDFYCYIFANELYLDICNTKNEYTNINIGKNSGIEFLDNMWKYCYKANINPKLNITNE